MSIDEIVSAAADVAALRDDVWNDIGPALTCSETEILADLFREVGIGGTARALILGHARGDEEGDDHYGLACEHPRSDEVQCNSCLAVWCASCDPGPAALCPVCHGRGYTIAPR